MRRWPAVGRALVVLALPALVAAAAEPIGAQAAEEDVAAVAGATPPAPRSAAPASPFVPRDHWSLGAARRLHAMGLMPPGYDPGVTLQTAGALGRAFEAAAASSALAAAYRDRLAEEFGDAGRPVEPRSWLGTGWVDERGRLYTGTGYREDRPWHPPVPRDAVSSATGGVRHVGAAGPVAWSAAAGIDGRGPYVTEAYVLAGWRDIGVWGGVHSAGFTTGAGTGVVLEALMPRPGVGVHLLEPVTLPWLLRHLGPVQATTMMVRARRNAEFMHPLVWATRVSFEPHPRLRLGVNRGIMLGGDGNDSFSFRHLAYILIGKHTGAYDNQLVSATFRYRPPVDALPLVAYFEWGLEDSAGAWKNVPGMMAGVEAGSLPFAPAASAGLAATWFQPSCCGNPMWYRNWSFQGGWADDGRLLGHALGGHGRELRGYGRVDLMEARAQIAFDAFARQRLHENVYAPTREGRSIGGGVDALFVLSPAWSARAAVTGEVGRRWREGTLELGVRGAL